MSNRSLIFLLIVLALFFVGAMYHLLSLQYTSGDAYPPYSSSSTQPLGTGAFYEALDSMPHLTVSRRVESIINLGDGRDTTLFLIGASTGDDPEAAVAAIEHFVSTGGRLVVGFKPVFGEIDLHNLFKGSVPPKRSRRREDESQDDPPLPQDPDVEPDEMDEADAEPTDEKSEVDEDTEEESTADKEKRERKERFRDSVEGNPTSVADRWGFVFEYEEVPVDPEGIYESVSVTRTTEKSRFPDELTWRSGIHFSELDGHWETLYNWEERAVLIERPWGTGSIALASDSFLFTNEAIRTDRSAELLAWFVGDNANVVFDETHLNIQEGQGIATLARKYNLEGIVFAIVLTALLFVWKSLVSLVPKRKQLGPIIDHSDKDTLSGLSNLFRRNIPKASILRACLDEWEQAHARDARIPANTRQEIRQLVEREEHLPKGKRNPVGIYKRICSILKERKHFT